MPSPRAHVHAAAAVAGLEGKFHTDFRGNEVESSSLAAVNRRVRLLESVQKIQSPPPTLDATWESLAWRICRLNEKKTRFPCFDTQSRVFSTMLPSDTEVSMETIQTLCMELGMSFQTALNFYAWPFPKCDDEDEMLDIIRQRLLYVAGRHDVDIKSVPITRVEIYVELVGLSLRLEQRSPMGYGMGGLPPKIIIPGTKKKSCCSCHKKKDDSDSDSDSDSDASSTLSSRRKRTFGFGWLRKLFCLRPKDKIDDDAASISTKSSSTLRDG